MSALLALFRREIALAYGRGAGAGVTLGLVFYLCLVILFPFGVGPNMKSLSLISPAIIWAGPLLSILLGVEKIFQPDADDGSLDLYRLSPEPLEAIILTKAGAFWCTSAVPLIAVSPLFAMMLGMEGKVMIGSLIALFIGSPALVFFGTLCAALTLARLCVSDNADCNAPLYLSGLVYFFRNFMQYRRGAYFEINAAKRRLNKQTLRTV